jgi:hypothetical protein
VLVAQPPVLPPELPPVEPPPLFVPPVFPWLPPVAGVCVFVFVLVFDVSVPGVVLFWVVEGVVVLLGFDVDCCLSLAAVCWVGAGGLSALLCTITNPTLPSSSMHAAMPPIIRYLRVNNTFHRGVGWVGPVNWGCCPEGRFGWLSGNILF